jgi:hypothetical protein
MRTCNRCHLAKPLEEFHVRYRATGERLTHCRDCMAEYKRDWYLRNTEHQKARVKQNNERTTRENQSRAWEYLGQHSCVDCGEADPVVLQFDHTGDKRTEISQMLQAGFNWSVIQQEIDKCEVRCANCHRRRTARVQGIYARKHAFKKSVDAKSFLAPADN